MAIVLVLLAAACGGSSQSDSDVTVTLAPTTTTATTTSSAARAHHFVTSSDRLRVGAPVTLGGSGCARGNVVTAGVGRTATAAGTRVVSTPRADGRWHATVTVGDSTALGLQTVVASCERASDHRLVFEYVPLVVHVTTRRHLAVTPRKLVPVGATVHVVPNLPCPANVANTGAFAGIIGRGDDAASSDGIGPRAVESVPLDPAGNWSADLTVPPGTPAGSYRVTAYCLDVRSYTAWYPPVTIKVAD